jgi:NitT/TauT family transport system substrate-binding protein
MSRRLTFLAAIASVLALAGCSQPTAGPGAESGLPIPTVEGWETQAVATLGATPAPVPVVVGLPYKPDVQFTPWYVADRRGYFEDEGFAVEFRYGDESSFVRLVAARDMTAVVASGEQVILARANTVPVTYVATWYDRFPGVVFSDDPALGAPAALVGHTVGLPALSGASYIGWQALLAANQLDPAEIDTQVIGYEQLAAVLEGRVDAAVGYAANEPVQLVQRGVTPVVIEIADSFNLVSNGLIVGDSLIAESPEVVQALVNGFLRGLRDTLADPDGAFAVALQAVPEAADPEVRAAQRAVLEASLRFWTAPRLGAIDPARWRDSQAFLLQAGLIEAATPIEAMIDARFVDAASVGR